MWKLPVGRSICDTEVVEEGEEPFLVNSLAGALIKLFNWAVCLELRRDYTLHKFPVSAEVALALEAEEDEKE
jgi:hypothetical protein